MKISAKQQPDLWPSKLDWSDYETYVFGSLQRLFPDAKVRQNVKLIGRLSGRSRQIDIVLDRQYLGTTMKIAVDCKSYKRKVDVKAVESFLGMLKDVGINKGVLVTTKGYTKAAHRRALYGDPETELRIIPPERLSDFQHIGVAFAWVEPVAAIVSPPEGWVVDNEDSRPERMQFSMYPLGHSRSSAMRLGAFMYGNIILKRGLNSDIEAVAFNHEAAVIGAYPEAKFKRLPAPKLSSRPDDTPAILREGDIDKGYKGLEYTLYIDHPNAVLTLVLLCPEGQSDSYLPLLLWVGGKTIFRDMVDERQVRMRETDGRIAVYWNRAKYVQVFRRSTPNETWQEAESYIDITEPRRDLQAKPNGCSQIRAPIQIVEFISSRITVKPDWRIDLPGQGWKIPLWRPNENLPKPDVLVHVTGLSESASVADPENLYYFSSTRSPFPPDEWPAAPGVDY